MPGVDGVLAGDVAVHGLGGFAAGVLRQVETAGDGFEVTEVGVVEAESGEAFRAESVGGAQVDEPAARADEPRAGAQRFVQRVTEGAGAAEAFRQGVQRGEVGDPGGEAVLEAAGTGAGKAVGGRGSLGHGGQRLVDSGHFRRGQGAHG